MKNKIRKFILATLLAAIVAPVWAQRYIDKTAEVSFFSSTPMEDIDAKNSSAVSLLDPATGGVEFAVLIKGFQFEKALMQEHFNENYMESEKFPKANFKGKISNLAEVDFKKDGTYPVTVTGSMTIHGVTKEVTIKGVMKVSGGKINANSNFTVRPADYNISIPKVVTEKIAEEIKVTVVADYDQHQSNP